MTFTQLEIFALVAELKSFTVTAARLGISQSAVSHAVKALEKEWQLSLLSRNQTDIELTDSGRLLLAHVKELLSINQTLQQQVAAIHGFHEGSIRIGSFGASSSIHLLPTILEAFSKQYPKIDIYIDEGDDKDIAQWLIERKIDVGFVVLPDERFDTFALTEDQFVALIPDGFALAQQAAIPPKELGQLPFIMTTAGSQKFVEQLLRLYHVKPHINYHFSQFLTIISMVNNQLGASIVAEMALSPELLAQFPHVVKRPLQPAFKRSVGLAVKNKKHLSPAALAFINTALAIEFTHQDTH